MNRRGGLLTVSALLAAAGVLLAGCQGDSGSSPSGADPNLPAASTLLATSAGSMAKVTSVHFGIDVKGNPNLLPVQDATGDLDAKGDAKGNAKLTELGQLVQVDFVLTGGHFYLKGPTGGWQTLPASLATGMFDPAAILNPDKGVAKVLRSVRNPATTAKQTVQGTDTYEVTGTVGQDVVTALVPGIDSDVSSTFWLGTDPKALPVRAEFDVPGKNGTAGATVDVTISRVDEPVSVTAPN